MTDRTKSCTPEERRTQELYEIAERAYESEPKKFAHRRFRGDRD